MSYTLVPVGSNVLFRFLLVSQIGTGLTGQTPVVAIKRRADSMYWNGTEWQSGYITLSMTQEDSVNLPGSYVYGFNQATADSSNPNEYLVRYINAAALPNTALDEEQWLFSIFVQSISPSIDVGHAMSDDGETFTAITWIEVGGLRVTDYTTMSAQIKDDQGNVVQNLGTTSSQTADGVFTFSCPVAAVSRNTPYILAIQAIIGITTQNFNKGFVRV